MKVLGRHILEPQRQVPPGPRDVEEESFFLLFNQRCFLFGDKHQDIVFVFV